jgi:hypothetical protein
MKLPLVKSALLPFFYMPWFWSFDFISSMVVSCLIKILFVAGAGFEPA